MAQQRSIRLTVALAGALAASLAQAGQPARHPPPAPLSRAALGRLASNPTLLRELIHPTSLLQPKRWTPPKKSHWQPAPHDALPNPGAMLQLTDGSILIQDQTGCNCGSGDWWLLTPDISGDYANGTFTQVASMPSGYAPLYFASAVLPDGRVIVEGGEYNFGELVWTNQGAIYDPIANAWTAVAPPDGGSGEWQRIGDGPGALLANGVFMFGASGFSGTTVEALLDPATLGWTDTGGGKADGNGEEGWSLLPDGRVLTVDTGLPPGSEIYDPATGMWRSAGNTPASLISDGETGPQMIAQNGDVLAVGATGANAVYSSATHAWSAAPSFPVIGGQQYDEADGPGAVLPNGQILLMASPGEFQTPSRFFLFDGVNLTLTEGTPNQDDLSSFVGFMLVLPTAQVLFNDRVGGLWLYNSGGKPVAGSAPIVRKVARTLARGQTYTLKGKQLSGLTQGAAYGDDYQSATNYPLVRLVNAASGHVFYARTSGFTSTAVQPGAAGSTKFTVPQGMETGAATLYAVASGVASRGKAVTVR